MSESVPRFSSLSELLANIGDKPFDEAKRVAEAELASANDCREEIVRVRKSKRSQAQCNLIDYFDILRVLLNAMDGHWFPEGVSNERDRKLIEAALRKWAHRENQD